MKKKYRMTKKFVCILMALALILTLAPAAVLAVDAPLPEGAPAPQQEPVGQALENGQGGGPSDSPSKSPETDPINPPENGITPPVNETNPVVVTAFDAPEPAAYEINVGEELPALPDTLQAVGADGEPIAIAGVTWECDAQGRASAASAMDKVNADEGGREGALGQSAGAAETFDAQTSGDYVFTAKLPEGYELSPDATLPQLTVTVKEAARVMNAALENVTLTVAYDGGDMQTAIDAALGGVADKADIVKIVVTGTATEITGDDWMALKDCFEDSSAWTNLTDLDLSGMSKLITISGKEEIAVFGNLKNLELPSGLKTIGDYAFAGCENLALTALPDGVTEIGESAFSSCYRLTELAFSDKLKIIGNRAFQACTDLKKLTFYGDTPTIGSNAFTGLFQNGQVYCPDGTTDKYQKALKAAGLPESWTYPSYTLEVTFNGDGTAMEDAIAAALPAGKTKADVTGIRVTGTATAITGKDWMALKSCFEDGGDWENLTDLDLSDMGDLKTISGQEANTTYGKLKTLKLPDNLETIGDYTFASCKKLDLKELPDVVGTIGDYAFYYCENLAALTWLPEGITKIGGYAFAGCEKLELAGLPEGVKEIGEGAFSGCANLEFTALPDSVEVIGNYAFAGCEKLVLTRLPDNVMVIPPSAFEGCIGLESLAFHSGFRYIGNNAFSGCKGLKELAFYTADLPKLEADVFTGLPSGGTVYCPNGKAGDYRTALEAAGLPVDWRYESFYTLEVVFDGGDGNGTAMQAAIDAALASSGKGKIGVTGIKVTGDATEITGGDWMALKSCFEGGGEWETLTDLDLSGMGKLKTISGENANGTYAKLKNLKLPGNLTSIGDYAFANCCSLALTELPEGVTAIEGSAFYGCNELALQKLPDGVTAIEDSAFFNCTNLALTALPDGVTSIGESAFLGCTGLTELAFPSGLNNLKDKAFRNCIKLKNLTFKGGSAPALGTDVFKNVPATGTLYYPEGGADYMRGTFGGDDLKDWTFTSVSPYKPGTLNDPDSGVTVKGNFTADAALRVGELQLHPEGCPACDKIREWQKTHEVAALYDISLERGSYQGDVEVSIPVDGKYNGQELTIHHCNNHKLETRTFTVQNGMATGTFGGLSPFGIFGKELEHPTPPPTPVDHGLIDPADPNKPIDLAKDAVFAFNGEYANLAGVRLDGHKLTQTATSGTQADLSGYPGYDGVLGNVKSGSVIVTLYKDFLKTLPNGKHTLTVEFADGSVVSTGDAQFTIEKQPEPTPSGQPTPTPTAAAAPTSPKTGDESNMALWIVLVCVAGVAIAGGMVYRKRGKQAR